MGVYTSVYVDALLILPLSRRSIDKYNGCSVFMGILHSEFELYVANMNKNGSIVPDKGPGQQVDVPQPLLLFAALHTESGGQNSTALRVNKI